MNDHSELRNGELSLEHLVYYFGLGRSLGNNKPARSPKKRALKGADKGKGKTNVDETVDPYYYNKWQICWIYDTPCVFQGTNKIKFLTTFEFGAKYYSEGYEFAQNTMHMPYFLLYLF